MKTSKTTIRRVKKTPFVYSAPQIAEILQRDLETVYKLIHSGSLRAVKIAGKYAIRQEWLDRLLEYGDGHCERGDGIKR